MSKILLGLRNPTDWMHRFFLEKFADLQPTMAAGALVLFEGTVGANLGRVHLGSRAKHTWAEVFVLKGLNDRFRKVRPVFISNQTQPGIRKTKSLAHLDGAIIIALTNKLSPHVFTFIIVFRRILDHDRMPVVIQFNGHLLTHVVVVLTLGQFLRKGLNLELSNVHEIRELCDKWDGEVKQPKLVHCSLGGLITFLGEFESHTERN